MVISTIRHRIPSIKPARQARKLSEYELAKLEAAKEIKEYEAEKRAQAIAAEVKGAVVVRRAITLIKM